ncbi:BrnT family toxin [Sphingomonas hengshuiensis]|uniref:BrnT family toxin n=1 Tax=Sphingomonas hengshuiensis TaxID=1609977 RepID=A0A7U4LFY4_9SPHN|nr:BrnT family toxin [Sphingomonas hengshuiensis]AJP72748.1 hypothetical protein TS85_14660 [Sphingomonas hengshuiensis]
MRYSYDEAKRARILQERGLDLADAERVFEGFYLSRADVKHSGEERRTITVGMLNDEVVVLVIWTPRDGERRIITMWKANEKERKRYHEQRDRSG